MKPKFALRSFLAVTGSSLLAISYSHADALIWDSNSGLTLAQDGAGSWTGIGTTFYNNTTATDNVASASGDTVQFGNGGTLASPATINVSTNSIAGLIFGSTNTSGYNLTASSGGQVLTIGGSGILMNSGAQATTVGSANLGILLGAAQSWTNNDDSLLTISGAVNKAGYLLTIGGTGNTTIGGKISGAGGLTKDGNGILTLGGLNDFSGGMILNAGTLNGTATQSFTGGLTVNGGSLGSGTFLQNIAVNFTQSSSIAIGTSTLASAAIAATKTLTVTGFTTGNSDVIYTFTNGISGSGLMQFNGGGSNTGQDKTLLIGNSSGFTGNISLEYQAVGSVSRFDFAALGDAGKITYAGGGNTRVALQLNYTGTGSTFGTRQLEIAQTVTGTFITSGIQVNSNGSGALVFNTDLINTSTGAAKPLILSGSYTAASNAFNGAIVDGTGTAFLYLTKSGAGTWNIGSSGNTFTGNTNITDGKLVMTNALALQNSAYDTTGSNGSTIGLNVTSGLNSGNLALGGLAGAVNLASAITNGYASITSLTLNPQTGRSPSYSGVIADATVGMDLIKNGAGTQTLTGPNTYTGTTTVTNGVLNLGVAENVNVSGPLGKQLANAAGTILLNGGTLQHSAANANDYSGRFSTAASQQYKVDTNGQNVTWATALTSSGGTLTKSGAGTLSLTNASNSYDGGTTVSGGTLGFVSGALGTTGTINASGGTLQWRAGNTDNISARLAMTLGTTTTFDTGGNNVTFGSGIGNSNTSALSKTGLGTLTLQGVNTYTGVTTVNGGTLKLDMAGGGALASTSPLTLGGGEFLVKGGSPSAQTVGSLVLTANTDSKITIDPNNGSSTILTLGNAWTRNAGSSLLIDYSSANTGTREVKTASATTTYTLSNGIYGGILVKDSAGVVGFATRAAGSNIAITRYNDTLGTTLAVASNTNTTNFTTLNSVYSSGTLTWTNGGVLTNRSVNSLTIDTTNTGGTIDMGVSTNVLTLTSLGILFKGTNDSILTGGKVGASGSEVIVHQTSSTNTLTINSPISAVAGSLTKDGVGTLIVGGANVYTGRTNVNAGTLLATNVGALPGYNAASKVTVANGATLAVNVDSGNWSSANITTLLGATPAAFQAGSNLGIHVTTGSFAYASDIGTTQAAKGLVKSGAGTLELTTTHTYTGATSVDGGKLLVNGNISTSVLTTVKSGATLGGTGTVGALTIDSGGFFSPGNSPGIEDVVGNYIQNGTLQVEIEGLTAGDGAGFHDRVDVAGTVTLNGLLDLITFSGTYSPGNMIFILLNDSNDAITGTFTGLAQGASVGTYQGWDWTISYLGDSGGNTFTGGNDVVLMAAIPEPRAALLGGLGMLMLLRRRRA